MEEREKFTFRKEWYDVIQELPVQVRSEVCVAIIEYGITGKLPLLKAQAKLAVHFIKKELDISVGNIIGSNIFNICMIIGITSCITPLEAEPNILSFDPRARV